MLREQEKLGIKMGKCMLVGMCLYIYAPLTQARNLCHDLNSRFYFGDESGWEERSGCDT